MPAVASHSLVMCQFLFLSLLDLEKEEGDRTGSVEERGGPEHLHTSSSALSPSSFSYPGNGRSRWKNHDSKWVDRNSTSCQPAASIDVSVVFMDVLSMLCMQVRP